MKDLIPAASIAIIGGADGPTSIYVEKTAILQLLIPYFVIAALSCFFLVRSILKKKKVAIVLSSVFCAIFILLPAVFFLGKFVMKRAIRRQALEIGINTYPWKEDEVADHTFELMNSENSSEESDSVESFFFIIGPDGKRYATCTFGKIGGPLAPSIKSWQIDSDGILYIFDESPQERDCIKIEKIWCVQEVLYAKRNQDLAKYKYYEEKYSGVIYKRK
ncbi:MAG: hypothetical protein IKN90_02350 [Treponema sp.]|nr:hypothetical protein [Treponema sp.]